MRKYTSIGLSAAIAVAALVGTLSAGEAQQAPETKRIGVVYIQQVFKNYNYAKEMEDRMRTTFTPDQQAIEGDMRRLQEMQKAFQNNPLVTEGSAEWRKKMMEIESLRLEIQAKQEEFGKRVGEEEAALWINMYNAFQRSCKTMGDYYQYDIIIATPDAQLSEEAVKSMNPMALQQEIMMRRIQYVNDRANLTKAVTDLLNHRHQLNKQDPQKNPL